MATGLEAGESMSIIIDAFQRAGCPLDVGLTGHKPDGLAGCGKVWVPIKQGARKGCQQAQARGFFGG